MKNITNTGAIIIWFSTLFIMSCTVEPSEIIYGEDQCSGCKMIIADSRFGCQLVTAKGKVTKYDAIECLMPAYIAKDEASWAYVLVSDYMEPGSQIDASNATYLISKAHPSPMGMYLSAYQSDPGDAALLNGEAEVLSWSQLQQKFK